jgi:hypothetical protein
MNLFCSAERSASGIFNNDSTDLVPKNGPVLESNNPTPVNLVPDSFGINGNIALLVDEKLAGLNGFPFLKASSACFRCVSSSGKRLDKIKLLGVFGVLLIP